MVSRSKFSRKLYAFVGAVNGAAMTAVLALPPPVPGTRWGATLVVSALAALVGSRPVRLRSIGLQISPDHPLILYALAALGPTPALLAALASLAGSFAFGRRWKEPVRYVFNAGAVVLTTAAAIWTFRFLGGVPGGAVSSLVWPLVGATAAYFLSNGILVSTAVSLEKGGSLLRTWRASFQWTAATYAVGASLAVGLLYLVESVGLPALVLGIPPAWMLVAFYQVYRDRLEERSSRVQEVESLNRELNAKVDELRHALAHVKQLQGLLPICMHCKSIRDDQDTWHRLEAYITEHTDARFTHSLCRSCRDEHYAELANDRETTVK